MYRFWVAMENAIAILSSIFVGKFRLLAMKSQ